MASAVALNPLQPPVSFSPPPPPAVRAPRFVIRLGGQKIQIKTRPPEDHVVVVKDKTEEASSLEVKDSEPNPPIKQPSTSKQSDSNGGEITESGGASSAQIMKPLSPPEKPSQAGHNTRSRSRVPEANKAVQRTTKEKKRKRTTLSVALTKEEIKEDILLMTGKKPARRPKKQIPKELQAIRDSLFPGLKLVSRR